MPGQHGELAKKGMRATFFMTPHAPTGHSQMHKKKSSVEVWLAT